MGRLSVIGTAVVVALCTGSAWAHADERESDPYQHHRGVMVGFGFGFSTASCNQNCDSVTSLGFDFHLGGFLNPRLALMYDGASWADSENGVTGVLASNTAAIQYWAGPRAWLKGGLGLSQARVSDSTGSASETGFGMTGAAGYELTQSGGFAMDVSGRLSNLDFEGITFTLFAAALGARWK